MLVLVHRAELLEQACDKIRRANLDLKIAVEQAGRLADPTCDVVVASVPTLGRRGAQRLKRLDPNRFFGVVVDEAHHATAATYRRVLDYVGVFEAECDHHRYCRCHPRSQSYDPAGSFRFFRRI
jgi:ATP-dependent helicase IRC3